MKKLIFLALMLVPSTALADRLGGLKSSADVALSTQVENGSVTMVFDGGGSALQTTVDASTVCVTVPFSATVSSWTFIVPTPSASGSISVTIRKAAYGDYPTFTAMSNGGTAPNISSSNKGTGLPTGWSSTAIAQGDTVCGQITSATTIQRATLSIWLVR